MRPNVPAADSNAIAPKPETHPLLIVALVFGAIIVLYLALCGIIGVFLATPLGERTLERLETIVPEPRELVNSRETLNAFSRSSIPVEIPYDGELSLEVDVERGNEITVYLVDADQLENVTRSRDFTHYPEFEAEKTKHYRRSGRFPSGIYYLILLDDTLGILSRSDSEVSVKAMIRP